jgi:F-type H+-transporting ATPase subunit gamma
MNLRQVRKKIKSISNVKKITKAMQLVSAVKMKKAQQLAVEGRPYRDSLQNIIEKLIPTVDANASPLMQPVEGAQKELVIFISSNKGLCGAFNVNLFRLILRMNKNMDFVTIGKKGASFAAGSGRSVVADFSTNAPSGEVSAIFQMALNHFLKGTYAKVSIVYNKFISTLRSESVAETLLPITMEAQQAKTKVEAEYLIEPSKQLLFENLLKDYVAEKIRGAILNSDAAEHSSRMIAMKNATDNANDVIYNLTLLRNKLRQQKITYELLDMITAKESVEGN